jgi:hypothetical protein
VPMRRLTEWRTSRAMKPGCSIMPADNEKSRLDNAARAGWL